MDNIDIVDLRNNNVYDLSEYTYDLSENISNNIFDLSWNIKF